MRLTPKEAAERARVSVALIYKWTSEEQRLPHYRAGGKGRRGRILIDPADLDAFLESQKVAATPAPPPRRSRGEFTHLKV